MTNDKFTEYMRDQINQIEIDKWLEGERICRDPIRIAFKRPIHVNSGFRTLDVNKAIGGAKNSQHCLGMASDITAGDDKMNKELFELILSSGIVFDQLIDEKNYRWIHISYNKHRNRQQILHLK